MSSPPSGIRLMQLLKEHLREIMDRERTNLASIHLYSTGSYWVAFERSAYQLRRVFPDSEITPMRLYAYPFPIVMVSVTDRSLRSYASKHILRKDEVDYKLLTVSDLSLPTYQAWHTREVQGLPSFN
ncbi:MAG: hypothetical protein PHC95_12940 [Parabacteroides sp.]|nr:hypothetical protein [Parabacteroides sp.]